MWGTTSEGWHQSGWKSLWGRWWKLWTQHHLQSMTLSLIKDIQLLPKVLFLYLQKYYISLVREGFCNECVKGCGLCFVILLYFFLRCYIEWLSFFSIQGKKKCETLNGKLFINHFQDCAYIVTDTLTKQVIAINCLGVHYQLPLTIF